MRLGRADGMTREELQTRLQNLFTKAKTNGGIEYLYTLLRVDGITNDPDPFIGFRALVALDVQGLSAEDLHQHCVNIADSTPVLSFLGNLLNCAAKRPFRPDAFDDLYTGSFPDWVAPTLDQKITFLKQTAAEGDAPTGEILEDVYSAATVARFQAEPQNRAFSLELHTKLRDLFDVFLGIYTAKLLGFRTCPTVFRQEQFEVLELHVSEGDGLFGFTKHFSNGSSATFKRHARSTECENLVFELPLNFQVGDLSALRPEWRIRNRRLYEVGLPGRYNKPGEWRPLIYSAGIDQVTAEARRFSPIEQVQDVFFYLMATGHQGIEFAVRANIELPHEYVGLGTRFHLWKVPPRDANVGYTSNTRIYDGWFNLEGTTPEAIAQGLQAISVGVNRLAFSCRSTAEWRLKYRNSISGGCCVPSGDELQVLNRLLREFPDTEDAFTLLNYALDWFNRGSASPNVFVNFICSYIAIESVAKAIHDEADFRLPYPPPRRPTPAEKRRLRDECIRRKAEALLETKPAHFVLQAYFECIFTLKDQVRKAAELVFGAGHRYVAALCDSTDTQKCLGDIRSGIAHGGLSMSNLDHYDLVAKRLPEVRTIAHEFLSRIILRLQPVEAVPAFPATGLMTLDLQDPRHTIAVGHEAIIANKDWRMRAEWCE